jgi:hypothetical protein
LTVSAGGARRGRRDNGLDAAEYVAAGDVDPRVGEHLLDVLAAGGIAAYLQPAADLNPVTRTTTMPPRPTDRLYVDRTHLSTARDYLARLAADDDTADEPAPPRESRPDVPRWPDIEAEWARIVASFNSQVDPTSHPWPPAEHIDVLDIRSGDPTNAPADVSPPGAPVSPAGPANTSGQLLDGRSVAEPSLLDGLDTFGADLPEADDEEGYTPPPPPPLPRISKYAVLGVLGVVGGFVLFLFPELLPIDSTASMLLGFTAILAGFVTLIWRLRPGGDDDDYDPDDGARV